ncbi:MAG TPA: glycosyltransferase [Thermoanaerobaculia bacterium]|nr:glycosyltransferase [Thermoanaerobaculia bacterium]
MIIAQLILPGSSEYERKSQRIDFASLSAEYDVRVGEPANADIVHVYAPREFDPAAVRDLPLPYVSNARPKARRFRKSVQPIRIITPLKDTDAAHIPEAVEDGYFANPAAREPGSRATVGTFSRLSLHNIIEQTAARIQRYRDDVDWLLFDMAPSPEDLRGVDVWVDPAKAEDDFDGFVAEAIAAGTAVIASRTAINTQRLEKGRSGVLVPPHDPNEWTHAILNTLFKPEFRHSRVIASQQTASKFRPRHRARALIQLYESILQ